MENKSCENCGITKVCKAYKAIKGYQAWHNNCPSWKPKEQEPKQLDEEMEREFDNEFVVRNLGDFFRPHTPPSYVKQFLARKIAEKQREAYNEGYRKGLDRAKQIIEGVGK